MNVKNKRDQSRWAHSICSVQINISQFLQFKMHFLKLSIHLNFKFFPGFNWKCKTVIIKISQKANQGIGQFLKNVIKKIALLFFCYILSWKRLKNLVNWKNPKNSEKEILLEVKKTALIIKMINRRVSMKTKS